jgi:sigma-B regulation protein RsbU (phosphoserine phosphatase)
MYLATSLVATMIGLVVLNFTLVPGLLGNPGNAMRMIAYSLILGTLVTGAALSYSFYRRAVDRAGADRELALARNIQRSFLLTEFPVRPRIEVHAENVSSREVSGDFYDVVSGGDHTLLLAIADVSGKGVPAALLSSMVQASLRTQAGATVSPAAMVTVINRLACDRGATGQFATLFLAAVDERDRTLRFTNAGHNHPVLLRAAGGRELLDDGGLLVGMMPAVEYTEGVRRLAPGDRVVIYTDGVTEAVDANGTMFGEERLYALLESLPPTLDARGIVEGVLAGVRDFLGDVEAGDDITVMALRALEDGESRS